MEEGILKNTFSSLNQGRGDSYELLYELKKNPHPDSKISARAQHRW
jgi:hypothetical protein